MFETSKLGIIRKIFFLNAQIALASFSHSLKNKNKFYALINIMKIKCQYIFMNIKTRRSSMFITSIKITMIKDFSQCILELRQIIIQLSQIYVRITQQIIQNKSLKHARKIIVFFVSQNMKRLQHVKPKNMAKKLQKIYFICTLDCDIEQTKGNKRNYFYLNLFGTFHISFHIAHYPKNLFEHFLITLMDEK